LDNKSGAFNALEGDDSLHSEADVRNSGSDVGSTKDDSVDEAAESKDEAEDKESRLEMGASFLGGVEMVAL
jgi:hypothetical protein